MWTIAALAEDFDVTVHSRGGFELSELNKLAGTTLSPRQVRLQKDHFANRLSVGSLAHGAYVRALPKVGADYDLRVTASGVLRWGLPAVHFISSAIWNEALSEELHAPTAPSKRDWRQRLSSAVVSATSGERRRYLDHDIFVANSHWTREQSAPYCPGLIEVIHPAVPQAGPGLPWDQREDAVLVFGRLAPEKRIESCIRIVEQARKRGLSARLVIAGPSDGTHYSAHVSELCLARREWVELLPALIAEDKAQLLGRMRYGLSACKIEAFGIATAEMAAAGVLVLVPTGCGQTEIVTDPRLQYESEEEAITKLLALQNAPPSLALSQCEAQRRFSPRVYMNAVRQLAGATLHNNLIQPQLQSFDRWKTGWIREQCGESGGDLPGDLPTNKRD